MDFETFQTQLGQSSLLNVYAELFYTLDDNEILMYKYNDNETKEYLDNNYIVLNF